MEDLTPQENFYIEIEKLIKAYHRGAPGKSPDSSPEQREDYLNRGFGVLAATMGRYMCHTAFEQGFIGANKDDEIVDAMINGLVPEMKRAFSSKKIDLQAILDQK